MQVPTESFFLLKLDSMYRVFEYTIQKLFSIYINIQKETKIATFYFYDGDGSKLYGTGSMNFCVNM